MDDKYFDILVKLAEKSLKKDEVPVSALIVKDNKILAKAYNNRKKRNCVLGHAEIEVINKASKKLKDWRLNDCELYVTLKPCSMCTEIIKQSRIEKVYYLLDKLDFKKEYDKTNFIKTNNSTIQRKYTQYLQEFFQNKRDKKK